VCSGARHPRWCRVEARNRVSTRARWLSTRVAGAEAPLWVCFAAPSKTLSVPSLYRSRPCAPIMWIGGISAARVLAAAGSAYAGTGSNRLLVPVERSFVFNPIVARSVGQGTRLKPCPVTKHYKWAGEAKCRRTPGCGKPGRRLGRRGERGAGPGGPARTWGSAPQRRAAGLGRRASARVPTRHA
jgi:hypothetical protein